MNSTVANVSADARGLELAQLTRTHVYVPVILGVIAIAVLSLASALLVVRIDRLATLEIGKALQTVLSTTEQALQSWADEHQANTRIWANRDSIVSIAQQLLNVPANPDALTASAIQQRARKELGPLYGPALYEGYFIISPSGINLSSSRDTNIGFPSILKDQESFLNKIWHGETAISLPQRSDVPLPNSNGNMTPGRATMFVGAPISDANRTIIAALVFRIDPFADFTRLLQRGRLGQTGETYAFDHTGRLISESRFDSQLQEIGLITPDQRGLLNIEVRDPGFNVLENPAPNPHQNKPLTRMALSAIHQQPGADLTGYRDYRGVKVVGAWTWRESLDMGLATEIDVTEAFEFRNNVTRIISFFAILSGALMLGLSAHASLVRWRDRRDQTLLENQIALRTRELREAEERGRQILESAGEGIYGLDLDGNTTFVNPAGAKMLGFEVDELIGKPMHALVHHSYPDGTPYPRAKCPMYAAFTVGEVQVVRNEALWRKDGTPFPVEYVSTPIRKGANLVGAVVTFRDITERAEIDKMKNDFVSTVSHELRTPLTSIRGSLGLVCAGAAGSISDKALELTTIALKNCERLTYLVNDILDLQKIESGQMQFDLTEQALNQLIRQAIEANAAFGGQYGVPFNFDPGPLDVTINVDANRLTQVLSNLLSNAVKFSPPGVAVEIRLERRKDRIRVIVADHGPGIPEQFKPRVFMKFSQADSSSSRKISGTGLGLNISKQLIEAMQGTIGFESTRGSGTRFYFELPIISPTAP